MYNNIDEVPQKVQDISDQFFKFIEIKRTIVLTPITNRGTLYEKWLKPEQYENLMEALQAAKKYLTRSDNWYSIILDDCGADEKVNNKENDDLPF